MRRLCLAILACSAMVLPAQADSVVTLGGVNWTINAGTDLLTLTPVVPGGNQPQNVQCIICGANQPQQSPTFGYTNYGNAGNQTTEVYFSTNTPGGGNPGSNTQGTPYDGAFLRAYLQSVGDLSLQFSVGVDVNDTNVAQTLTSFYMLDVTTRTVLAAFNTPTLVPSQNNGTGFPDYTLSGFDISVGGAGGDIHAGDQIAFFARIDGANDGPDSFFIQPAAVPGPIVGAGIPGLIGLFSLLGLNRLRRWRRQA